MHLCYCLTWSVNQSLLFQNLQFCWPVISFHSYNYTCFATALKWALGLYVTLQLFDTLLSTSIRHVAFHVCTCTLYIILYQCTMASSANYPFFSSSYSSDIRHAIIMSAPHTLSMQWHQEPNLHSYQDISTSYPSHLPETCRPSCLYFSKICQSSYTFIRHTANNVCISSFMIFFLYQAVHFM